MFRKLVLALGAVTVIAAAALTPTAASAHHWKHWHHGYYWGLGFYPVYYAGTNCYITRQVYWDSWGKHVRRVQVCN
ncbi:MAG TPA: hypothetical protein VFA57_12655 [Pseudolabrys sp.]|nr:hypothetical protein [Pseudolabrys sp.]HZT26548.1 hypothetical protein [Pseudolabrys sp.]